MGTTCSHVDGVHVGAVIDEETRALEVAASTRDVQHRVPVVLETGNKKDVARVTILLRCLRGLDFLVAQR